MAIPKEQLNINEYFAQEQPDEERFISVQVPSGEVRISKAEVVYTPTGGDPTPIAVLITHESPATRSDGHEFSRTNRVSPDGGRWDLNFLTKEGIARTTPLGLAEGHLEPTQPPLFGSTRRLVS